MKHYQIMPRNWFLINGKPRPVTGLRRQYVFAPESSEYPQAVHFDTSLIEPMTINEDLIHHSNLRSIHFEYDTIYDSLRLKHETISLPFLVSFDYTSPTPCKIIFPKGDIIRFKHIHRLQQFIQYVTGEEMRIRMKF